MRSKSTALLPELHLQVIYNVSRWDCPSHDPFQDFLMVDDVWLLAAELCMHWEDIEAT